MSEERPAIAIFASFSGSGGVERMLVNLIHGFIELGREVDLLLVRSESPHVERLPAAVNVISLGSKHTFLALFPLARYLRRRNSPALLVVKDRAGRTAVLARRLARTDTRLVLRLGTHLSTAMADKSKLARWLRYWPIRRLYPHIDQIAAVSEGVAADTVTLARLPRQRIRVVHNPVITPELAELAALPCPHPWLRDDGPPVILGSGRFQRQKDFPTLIRAFDRVRRQRPCRLIILGEGNGRARLQALIAELDLGEIVDLPGFQDNPFPFLANAALFVLSSRWEGSPNVLTEAMALGVPVVATDCPSGPRELLAAGRFGRLVPVGDADALAQAMGETLDQPLSPATLKAAVADYTQAESARHYLELLEPRIPPVTRNRTRAGGRS